MTDGGFTHWQADLGTCSSTAPDTALKPKSAVGQLLLPDLKYTDLSKSLNSPRRKELLEALFVDRP